MPVSLMLMPVSDVVSQVWVNFVWTLYGGLPALKSAEKAAAGDTTYFARE